MATSGYSKTPLAKKLGYKAGFTARVIYPLENYLELLPTLPDNITFTEDSKSLKDLIHFFTKDVEELYKRLEVFKGEIVQNGMIWVSWPKKTSKVPSTMREDLIRNHAIKIGLVDIKVCSVNEIWSALKLVIPVKDRKK